MSTSYKLVFGFSFFMMILCLLGGSKGGVGALVWGYVLWLMHKRDNKGLEYIFILITWFAGIGGLIGLIFILKEGNENLLNLALFEFLLLISLSLAITISLKKFFKIQYAINKQGISERRIHGTSKLAANSETIALEPVLTPSINSKTADTGELKLWEEVLREFQSIERKEGLWAKCFAESGGDENKAKAMYLTARYDEISKLNKNKEKAEHAGNEISKISGILLSKGSSGIAKESGGRHASNPNYKKRIVISFITLSVLLVIGLVFFNKNNNNSSENPTANFFNSTTLKVYSRADGTKEYAGCFDFIKAMEKNIPIQVINRWISLTAEMGITETKQFGKSDEEIYSYFVKTVPNCANHKQ